MLFFKKPVTSFETITLHLSGMRYICEYEIVCGGETSEISRYGLNFHEGKKERVLDARVTRDTSEILQVLNKCNVIGWNGFHGAHPRGVLDGTMFGFDAAVNGGVKIRADGSQNFPRHFHDFRQYVEDQIRN